ncbi:MAG: hypothetical protein R6W89_04995 [Candidatus Hydrogenedentota bacterium]
MYKDLIEQAEHLVYRDPRKPKQANLRRAVSAAYYALFHYLVQEACRTQMGTQHTVSPHRRILGRAFGHANMKKACKPFSGGALPDSLCKGLDTKQVSNDIRTVATTFVDLQDKRHRADYDLTEPFRRNEALYLIKTAKRAIETFGNCTASDEERRFFLACLWAWPELSRR